MSENSQVTRLLAKRFSQPGERGRIVFWRDDKKQYVDDAATLVGECATDEILREVELITPEIGDENDKRYIPFTVRYRMFHEQTNQKFLVYLTEPAPAVQDNWLLDLELAYGPTFTMDKLAVTLTETLPEASADTRNKWLEVMKRAPKFFDSEERTKRFAKRLNAHDDATDFQAKMIATLLQLKDDRHSMQAIWAELLTQYSQGDDSGITTIGRMGLSAFHWTGTGRIYHFDVGTDSGSEPTVKDFVLWLFQLAWNGFSDGRNAVSTYANIIRDWDDWYKNIDMRTVLQNLSENAVEELHLSTRIADMSVEELADRDLFRDVDEMIVNKLFERLGSQSITDDQVQRIINGRKQKLWYAEYTDQYECIAAASRLRAVLTECGELISTISSPEQGMKLYAEKLYKADGAYRRYVLAWHRANPDAVGVDNDLQSAYEAYQQDLG
ncbi:BREX-1 system phosphatase PglZ type A, partial [Bifidobacterium bifidum]